MRSDQSFCQRFVNSCESRSGKVAMRVIGNDVETLTFGELLRQARSIAYRLGLENITPGDRVAIVGDDHPCWAAAYLGVLYRGAVCVPLDPAGPVDALTDLLEESQSKLVFLSAPRAEKFRRIEERLGCRLPAVVWRAENAADGYQKFEDWTQTDFPETFAGEDPAPRNDDNALLLYTSGTTGPPKGVLLTHGNIAAALDGIKHSLRLSEHDRILSLVPLWQSYLQVVNLWAAVAFGCEVGFSASLAPEEIDRALKEFRPTILTTTPGFWSRFHRQVFDAAESGPRPKRALFRSKLAVNARVRAASGANFGARLFRRIHESFGGQLRMAVTAGSRIDRAVTRDLHRLGLTIIEGYGLTETSGAACFTPENDCRAGSAGKPVLNTEVKLDKPDSEGVGEVLIRGPIVCRGYYRNPAATREAFTADGWLRTGDLGKFDGDGRLYIVGRKQEVIVLPSGKNVFPEDVESHYRKTPLVAEVAVVGLGGGNGQQVGAEKLAAVAVPDFEFLRQANIPNSREAIRYEFDNLGRELPEHQRVSEYIIRTEPLPRTPTFKIKRFEVKKALENGPPDTADLTGRRLSRLSSEDQALLASESGRTILKALRQSLGDARFVHPQMNLEIDLGLDSLGRVEFFAAVEHAFATEFTTDEAARALTVREVIELVETKMAASASGGPVRPVEVNWSTILRQTDEDFPELETVLRRRHFFITIAYLAYKSFNLFCRVFMRLEVRGLENLRTMKRPFLVCPNHQSFFDPFIVTSIFPYEFFINTFHVGASQFFQTGFMRWVAKMLHIVPIDPDIQLIRAMKAGALGLKKGKILNIYPEGERAFDGKLHEFKKGAAILAAELDLPILPVALDGLYKVWPRRTRRIRPGRVIVTFGCPFYARDILAAAPATASAEFESAATNSEQPTTNAAKYSAVTKFLKAEIVRMIEEARK